MSRAWRDPDDVQSDMLYAANRTNQLLEQILSELKNRNLFMPEEKHEIDEKKKPAVVVFDADGPKSYCTKCDTEAVFDKIERKYFCPHCRQHISDMICPTKEQATCPVCGRDGELVHNGFGVVGDWVYCKHCGCSSRLSR